MASPNSNFRLPEEDRVRWDSAALVEGRTLSSLIKQAVETYIAAAHPSLRKPPTERRRA